MTQLRRVWLGTFIDRAILADLLAAARSCMTAACSCEPEDCPHAHNRMTPLDFAEWVETEVRRAERQGDSLLTREHKEAGARRRWREPLEAIAS